MNNQQTFDLGLPEPEWRSIRVREHERHIKYRRGSKASKEAGWAAAQSAAGARQRVLETIRNLGPISDRQIQGHLAMPGDTERPRRIELVEQGLIKEAGEIIYEGRRQTTWIVT